VFELRWVVEVVVMVRIIYVLVIASEGFVDLDRSPRFLSCDHALGSRLEHSSTITERLQKQWETDFPLTSLLAISSGKNQVE
jgi:hypothetical protein